MPGLLIALSLLSIGLGGAALWNVAASNELVWRTESLVRRTRYIHLIAKERLERLERLMREVDA